MGGRERERELFPMHTCFLVCVLVQTTKNTHSLAPFFTQNKKRTLGLPPLAPASHTTMDYTPFKDDDWDSEDELSVGGVVGERCQVAVIFRERDPAVCVERLAPFSAPH